MKNPLDYAIFITVYCECFQFIADVQLITMRSALIEILHRNFASHRYHVDKSIDERHLLSHEIHPYAEHTTGISFRGYFLFSQYLNALILNKHNLDLPIHNIRRQEER